MPIYEYQCKACGHQLEAFQKMSDAPLTDCPHCHKQALTKLISATSFQLKGTGWYATDFKNKGKPPEPAAKNDTASGKPSDKKDNTTTSSPATKDGSSSSSSSSSSSGGSTT